MNKYMVVTKIMGEQTYWVYAESESDAAKNYYQVDPEDTFIWEEEVIKVQLM